MQKKIDEASFNALSYSQSQRNWLEIAEYASLIGAALGSVMAAVSGQVLYAAAPLTVSLSLNLANRQTFEQQTQQNINAAIADVHMVVDCLHHQIQTLPPESDDIDEILSDLQQKLRSLETVVLGQQDWETLNVRFLLIEEKLTHIKDVVADLQQQWTPHSEGNEMPATVSLLPTLMNQPTPESPGLYTQIEQLQEQIELLQQQNRTIVKPYLQRLTRAVKQLQAN